MQLVARVSRGLVIKVGWWGNVNKMNLTITRKRKTTDAIFGVLSIDTSLFTCFTLENLLLAIKPGVYKVTFDYSPRFNRKMPHIWVPDRDAAAKARGEGNAGLRVHWANFAIQLDGCVAVGDKEEPDAIDNSVVTFNKLFSIINGQEVTLTIVEAFV